MSALLDSAGLRACTDLPTVELHAELGSTMDRARELAAHPGLPLPALVVAERQLAGRGRRAAGWWQPPGSLAMTLVLGFEQVPAAAGRIAPLPLWSPACGLAVAEAIARLRPELSPQVRWPNDVELHGRKLAGVLVEATTAGHLLIGIGINTTGSAAAAPAAIADRLTTLVDATGTPLAREPLLTVLIPELLQAIAAAAEPCRRDDLIGRYRRRCSLTGSRVSLHGVMAEPLSGTSTVSTPVQMALLTGVCRGIDRQGRLVVESAAGRLAVVSGSLTPPDRVWSGPISAAAAD